MKTNLNAPHGDMSVVFGNPNRPAFVSYSYCREVISNRIYCQMRRPEYDPATAMLNAIDNNNVWFVYMNETYFNATYNAIIYSWRTGSKVSRQYNAGGQISKKDVAILTEMNSVVDQVAYLHGIGRLPHTISASDVTEIEIIGTRNIDNLLATYDVCAGIPMVLLGHTFPEQRSHVKDGELYYKIGGRSIVNYCHLSMVLDLCRFAFIVESNDMFDYVKDHVNIDLVRQAVTTGDKSLAAKLFYNEIVPHVGKLSRDGYNPSVGGYAANAIMYRTGKPIRSGKNGFVYKEGRGWETYCSMRKQQTVHQYFNKLLQE